MEAAGAARLRVRGEGQPLSDAHEEAEGPYSDPMLQEWAEWLAARLREGKPVFAYFNNDVGGHAPRDAVRLRTMIEGLVGQVGQVGQVRARGAGKAAG